jgi:ribosomal protein S18 acetylase RimI-like enzyme
MSDLRIVDVRDERSFVAMPLCADPRFDHRTCDYWENAERGSNASRPAWLNAPPPASRGPRTTPSATDNPFARPPDAPPDPALDLAAALRGSDPLPEGVMASAADVFAGDDLFATPGWNPFAPGPGRERPRTDGVPRKLALLDRGRGIFGSYARVAFLGDQPVAYAQFGPLSAYPRAQHIRELYAQLPAAPPPGVITCIATSHGVRGSGHARALVQDVCAELARRGFAAVEAYPDLTRPIDETSAATPQFWIGCGFHVAAADERYPVMRRDLE